jgi:hypothetical protein
MARHILEPEDIQTAHDANLFDQEETDSTMSGTENFVDPDLTQPSSSAMRVDNVEFFDCRVMDGSRSSASVMQVDKREMEDAQDEQVVCSVVQTKFVDETHGIHTAVREASV